MLIYFNPQSLFILIQTMIMKAKHKYEYSLYFPYIILTFRSLSTSNGAGILFLVRQSTLKLSPTYLTHRFILTDNLSYEYKVKY